MTAREQIHQLVDELPENELETVQRVLTGLSVLSRSNPATSAPAKAPRGDEPAPDCEAEQIEEGERDLRNGRTAAADRRMRALDRALACSHPTGNIDRMLADIERGRDLH